ncbi:hypothetical protein N8I77_000610 [Diaporthe amygdali]|uniref:R3H-associated N-terminal domain-containing protein n=1 Tax=Phomopsis amygdali TaxID=1214568 RepID=A0AAD9SMG9_PHOAM|nr:hypothetical protein N8I77_000610 [Diaporthe amygdali]
MAIYSAVPPPPNLQSQPTAQAQNASQQPTAAAGPIDIEAWTISALESLSVSPSATGTTGRPLSIPLDEHTVTSANAQSTARVTIAVDGTPAADAITPPRRPPSRRDSLRRRELLLKGKEGSRQRRRYDMKRLTDVPNVEPPEPSDWEPRPVYPIHHVPYHVATFWERGLRQQAEDKSAAARKKKAAAAAAGAGRVPRELRDTVKRTPGVKGWLRALEEPVRQFLLDRHQAAGEAPVREDESDVSDDEVVFVGRKKAGPPPAAAAAAPRDAWKGAHREVRETPVDRGMVFDSAEDDESGAFKRWLTHSISDYYGLVSRSVTVGSPGRRCVYIGVRDVDLKIRTALPRPLWELF